jgi:glycosyltransferase involved in cell wall biosynthesis
VSQLAPALDLFWLTSEPRSEGVPTTVEEAMALGIPVVAANVGGVREIVHDGETGSLVPPRDPAALVDATLPLLGDAALRRRLGEAARVRAVADFDLDRCADTHVTAFERAIAHRATRRLPRRKSES